MSLARRGATIARASAFGALLSVCAGTQAADVPATGVGVDLVAREQPVDAFISALFREIGVPVFVGDDLEGIVNGRFEGTAAGVLGEVAKAFDVIFYHDGAVTYAYPSNVLTRKILPVSGSTGKRVERAVRSMAIADSANRVVVNDSGLLVTGTPRFSAQVQEIVESVGGAKAPAPTAAPKPVPEPVAEVVEPIEDGALAYRVFRLKHAWADDTNFRVGGRDVVVPGVASIVNSLISDEPQDQVKRSSVPTPNTMEGLRGSGLADTGGLSSLPDPETGSPGRSASSGGTMRVVPDARLNAVIVRDTPERMPAYRSLIDSLDVESKMVEIEATIIDVNMDMSRELGVNWRAGLDDGDVLFGNGTTSDQRLLPGTSLITPQAQGGVLSLALGESADFLARIRLLEERGAARVVSKPHVITLSDVEAVLGATTEFFIRVAGLEQVDLFNVPVGTLLRVTPHVFSDDFKERIKLLVNIEDGSQSSSQVDGIPVVERANISTQALIDDGDSLLVGGLVRDTYLKSDFRVPVLGSIPLLGRLFRSDRESATRVERLFLITPRVSSVRGFDDREGLPRLEGAPNDILKDASSRLDSVEWPLRESPGYWPDETSDDTSEGIPALIGDRDASPFVDAQDRSGNDGSGPYVSRFTVEKWSTNSQ